ncbi:MAG: hypothetical protein FJX23_03830 [Alphaproteobacteria bacterium]|nr:hypothetical protein [Alphaproteobacteria bacterium]
MANTLAAFSLYVRRLLELLFVLAGMFFYAITVNLFSNPALGFIEAETLKHKVRGYGQQHDSFLGKSFCGHDFCFGYFGVFNLYAASIAIFFVAMASIILCGYMCRAKKTVSQSPAKRLLEIVFKAFFFLISIYALDYALDFSADSFIWRMVLGTLWFSSGFFVVAKINRIQGRGLFYSAFEFAVIQAILISMLVMNHSVYCEQRSFVKPMLSSLTPLCQKT